MNRQAKAPVDEACNASYNASLSLLVNIVGINKVEYEAYLKGPEGYSTNTVFLRVPLLVIASRDVAYYEKSYYLRGITLSHIRCYSA